MPCGKLHPKLFRVSLSIHCSGHYIGKSIQSVEFKFIPCGGQISNIVFVFFFFLQLPSLPLIPRGIIAGVTGLCSFWQKPEEKDKLLLLCAMALQDVGNCGFQQAPFSCSIQQRLFFCQHSSTIHSHKLVSQMARCRSLTLSFRYVT